MRATVCLGNVITRLAAAWGIGSAILTAGPAGADILNVPGDFSTIQAAVDAAQSGDEIVLALGTYESPSLLFDRDLVLTIRSADPDDSEFVGGTVLIDSEGEPLITAVAATPGASAITLDGLTVRRSGMHIAPAYIASTGVPMTLRRCILEGDPRQSGTGLLFDFVVLPGDGVVLDIDRSTLRGDLRLSRLIGSLVMTRSAVEDSTFAIDRIQDVTISECTFVRHSVVNDIFGRVRGVVEMTDTLFRDIEGNVLTSDTFDSSGMLANVILERVHTDNSAVRLGRGTFVDCVVRECGRQPGGNWGLEASVLTARGCTFENNTLTPLHAYNRFDTDSYLVEDCVFRNNESRLSALDTHGSGVIRRCLFENNTGEGSGSSGSAIVVIGPRTVSTRFRGRCIIDSCSFIANGNDDEEFRDDSVILSQPLETREPIPGEIIVMRSSFVGNRARHSIIETSPFPSSAVEYDWPTFDQCVFIGNSSQVAGIHRGSTDYRGCTFYGNTGDFAQLGWDPASLTNCILVVPDPQIPTLIDGSTSIQAVTAYSIVPPDAQGLNTLTIDPGFVRLPSDGGDGWGDDPSTPGVDESLNDDFGDLRLRPSSHAIDRGDAALVMPGDTDLDGHPRLADDPGIPNGPGGALDMGAYEFQGASCIADVNADGVLTPSDFKAWIAAYNNGSAIADQNRDGLIASNDFVSWIQNYNTGCP